MKPAKEIKTVRCSRSRPIFELFPREDVPLGLAAIRYHRACTTEFHSPIRIAYPEGRKWPTTDFRFFPCPLLIFPQEVFP